MRLDNIIQILQLFIIDHRCCGFCDAPDGTLKKKACKIENFARIMYSITRRIQITHAAEDYRYTRFR